MTFDPGWRASVGGETLIIHETAIGQMGIVVPPGEHLVEIRFRDPTVLIGAILSLGGLLIVSVLWTRSAREQNHRGQ
jgi:uncharacterized membrane protein YfhO